jgi:hypothetical protein
MRLMNLNTWWRILPGARETADVRNIALFEIFKQMRPDVITLQECDPEVVIWLINNGYYVSLGLMSSPEPLIGQADCNDCGLLYGHLAIGIASLTPLVNPRCYIYGNGFWPKRVEVENAKAWRGLGGEVLGTNLNTLLLVAEVNGITVGTTHSAWEITDKPKNGRDQTGNSKWNQVLGARDLCRVIEEHELQLDVFAGDSNTHSGYNDSVFQMVGGRFELRMAFPPSRSRTMDRQYCPKDRGCKAGLIKKRHKKERRFDPPRPFWWTSVICPDNVLLGKRLKLVSAEQRDGPADHRIQIVACEKV